jgi:hypothetical protein
MTISSPGRDSERFFASLFVCLCLSGVWQLKHLHLQLTELNATSGRLLAPPRREGTKQEYPRQYQTPFAPRLFTNISPTLYILWNGVFSLKSLWNGVFNLKSLWNGVFNLKSLWNGA